jgi:hypothetical protein
MVQSKYKRLSFTLPLSVKMTAMGEKSLRKANEDVPLLEVAEMSVGVSQTGIMVGLNKTGNKH